MSPTSLPAPPTAASQIADFQRLCEARTGRVFADAMEFHRWSVDQSSDFWRALWETVDLPWSGSLDRVRVGDEIETAEFFPDVRLNYAEALLRPIDGLEDAPALRSVHGGGAVEVLTRRELREAVERTSAALAALGLRAGERVVLIAPSHREMTVAVLAAAALGATVSTGTPDVGVAALLGRFEQVDPVLLFLDRGPAKEPETLVEGLLAGLPTVRHVLTLDALPLPEQPTVPVDRLADLVATAGDRPEWPRLPFAHPLFVMFSSGTTGPPKAMVHGVGGTLIEQVKEQRLHCDLRPGDALYFHATPTWMVWNWQLAALALGVQVVLFDGPLAGPATLWELVERHGVTQFGTSPAYLQLCEDADYRPAAHHDLSVLRAIMTSGSVLHEWQYDWVAETVGPVPLQSVSGGTDILGCFVLGHPDLPVRRGRSQSLGLGFDLAAVDEAGEPLVGAEGDLVCRAPFPSRPVGFLRDPDGRRFHAAYFVDHPGFWTHGDRIEIAADGTSRVLGRSDGVLNVNGIRIGPSEIYQTLRSVPAVSECMAVEQRDPVRAGSTRMVLLVVLAADAVLDAALDREIRRVLRRENSAAHVPELVLAVPALPHTHNGKRSERAARDAVNGDPVANETSLRNAECLDAIRAAVRGSARLPEPRPATEIAAPVTLDPGPAPAPADGDLLAVRELWQDVLGVRPEPDDDFLDMGGSSRGVVELLRRIKLQQGLDVTIEAFFADPTPAGLARAVAAARSTTLERSRLLRAGAGRPIHLFCDAWGQLNSFHTLVARLRTTRPVWGIAPPVDEADGTRIPVAQVVDEAVAQVRTVQPVGPYSLLGYSFGGLVGYEVAARLRTEGHDVDYLGLLDVLPPTAALTPAERRAHSWEGRFATLTSSKLREALTRRLGGITGRTVEPDRERAEYEKTSGTFDAHVPRPYPGMVTYYQAADRRPVIGNQLAAWLRLAPHLVVTTVPGHHETMLGNPFVDEVAERISVTLR
ncbi:acetoacetate--CoA ligase [Pseudonocardia oroxyli]|uniref:Acetoacetyl-CoA synthetase n=1 Tax=Pseudonocardia oroxyli TaxID=366584 RepID=A0A1G7ZCA8_PSEOR|nr:acetoacetate--CoA ligase [Pseudonocardia oroxyli]SDH06217.1 acetoacetyl-CoA synthetase [Pseudonocardia oroxyli]